MDRSEIGADTVKLLMVEDDEQVAHIVKRLLLKRKGSRYDWRHAETLEAGLECLNKEPPDVILLDLELPDSNGLKTLSRIFEQAAGTPIIVLTAMYDEEMAERALKLGAAEYFYKPDTDQSSLWRAIRYAIDRARTQHALRESEERYRKLVEMSPDAIAIHKSGRIVFINNAGIKLLGAESPNQFIGEQTMDLFHPDCRELVENRIERIAKGEKVPFVEEKLVRLDGTYIDVEVCGIPFTYENGPAVQIIARDIFERKQAEKDQKQSEDRLRSLSHRLVQVQEEERHRIAKELHDEVGQILTALEVKMEMARRGERHDEMIAESQTLVRDLLAKIRSLSLDLRPTMLDDLGLLPALFWHFDRYTSQTGVRVNFRHSGLETCRASQDVETAAFRIVQEALTNVARHAGVDQAVVRFLFDQETLRFEVIDRGVGFDSDVVLSSGQSVGISGMQERAALLGGHLNVISTLGAGTCISGELPTKSPPKSVSLNV